MDFLLLRHSEGVENPPDLGAKLTDPDLLRDARQFRVGKSWLILWERQSGAEQAVYEAANGDLIAVCGSLLFGTRDVPDCLPSLLDEFEPDSFKWQALLGSHVILIHKKGHLYLLGDGLGACKIYTNEDHSICSSSFLALLELAQPKTLDRQACYEYVTSGSVFGEKTLVEELRTLPANAILSIDGENAQILRRPSPIANEPAETGKTLDQVAEEHCTRLSEVFAPIAENYGDRIRLSFSGGFDSRLMLAKLLELGARPTLFVYGGPEDEDVRIARLVTEGEGLPLEHIDKSTAVPSDPEAFIEETEQNLYAFDGWKVETPLFDFGEDRRDRARRHLDGQIPLNGSLGEIYRNFFYMPDRPSSTGAVVSTFYSRYDPRAFTAQFVEAEYRAAMAKAMREAVNNESD